MTETKRDYVKIQELVDQAGKLTKELNEVHRTLEDMDVMNNLHVRAGLLVCTYTIEMMKSWNEKPPELIADWASIVSEGEPGYTKQASYDGCEEDNDD